MSLKQGKIRKNLGIGFIIASTFFLFNPDIAIIDIIPDVFGYLLLLAGISQFSEVNDKIAEAKECFKKAAICNAIKLGLIVVLFGLVTPREMPVSLLLFTFVMNIFDLIFVIPGYLNFFGGLMYLGERLDSDYVLARRRYTPRECPETYTAEQRRGFERRELMRKMRCERSLSNTEKFQRSTIIFVLFKAVTPVLPEFTSLLNYEYSDSLINYYDFIYLFRALAVILMFVVGVVWLVSAIRYYVGIIHDRRFIDAVKKKYAAEVLPNKVLFMKKFVSREKIFIICSAFFVTNLYFDEYNILPSVISAVLLGIAAIGIREYSSKWKFCLVSSVLLAVSSVSLEYLRAEFNAEFIKEQIMRNPEAYAAWERMFTLSCAEGVSTVLAVISILLLAGDVVKKYTGFFMKGTDAFDPERATRELHRELTRPLIVTGIFGVLAALCVPFYFYAMALRFEAVWFLDLVFSLVFAACLTQNLQDITKNINYGHFVGGE